MHVFEDDHYTPIYGRLMKAISEEGELEAKTRDLTNINMTLNNPENSLLLFKKKHWKWAFIEMFDRLSPLYFDDRSRWNPGTAYHTRPAWDRKLDKEGGVFDYSYGDHFKDQLPAVIKLLSSKKTDREGIISVWEPKYLVDRDKYQRRPCTLELHFFRRGEKLNCNAYMRSNDAVNLLPFDIFHHSFIQRFIALKLGCETGYYSHTVSHAYYPKRRESKGREYLTRMDKKLKKNWFNFLNEHEAKSSPIGSLASVEHDLELYYNGEQDPKDYQSPLLKGMVSFIHGKKINEFVYL